MSAKGRRENPAVTHKLQRAACDYPFVQSVRLLERAAVYEEQASDADVATNPVAGFKPPATEAVRFSSNQSLSFPAAEIAGLRRSDDNGATQWQLLLNLIGLTGAMGVLPQHYSELVLSRLKQKDLSLEKFLNIFNHRSASLFFQASAKYHLPLQYERNQLQQQGHGQPSAHTRMLLSLLGLGTEGMTRRLHTSDEALINYAGLFNLKIRTASNLEQLLRSHFAIPVAIGQFVGQWQDLIDDVRSKLPDIDNPKGRNAVLGHSAMIGRKGWFAQGKIQIILGPLDKGQLKKFAPGTSTLKALNELVRLYVGLDIDYEFVIRIRKRDIPEKTTLRRGDSPVLGWNTWLRSKSRSRPTADETLDLSVSASQLK